MSTVSVRALKDQLSEYLRKAEAGERVVVTRDGKPVVGLVAFKDLPAPNERAILERMVAEGTLSRVPLPFSFEGLPAPAEIEGEPLSQTLIRMRREARY